MEGKIICFVEIGFFRCSVFTQNYVRVFACVYKGEIDGFVNVCRCNCHAHGSNIDFATGKTVKYS